MPRRKRMLSDVEKQQRRAAGNNKRAQAMRGLWNNEEFKRKRLDAIKEGSAKLEVRDKMAAATARNWDTVDGRAAYLRGRPTREQNSEKMKRQWRDPTIRAHMMDGLRSLIERRAGMNANAIYTVRWYVEGRQRMCSTDNVITAQQVARAVRAFYDHEGVEVRITRGMTEIAY